MWLDQTVAISNINYVSQHTNEKTKEREKKKNVPRTIKHFYETLCSSISNK